MRLSLIAIAALAACTPAETPPAPPAAVNVDAPSGEYMLDKAHTSLVARANHLGGVYRGTAANRENRGAAFALEHFQAGLDLRDRGIGQHSIVDNDGQAPLLQRVQHGLEQPDLDQHGVGDNQQLLDAAFSNGLAEL